jgi:hypothetical protein
VISVANRAVTWRSAFITPFHELMLITDYRRTNAAGLTSSARKSGDKAVIAAIDAASAFALQPDS